MFGAARRPFLFRIQRAKSRPTWSGSDSGAPLRATGSHAVPRTVPSAGKTASVSGVVAEVQQLLAFFGLAELPADVDGRHLAVHLDRGGLHIPAAVLAAVDVVDRPCQGAFVEGAEGFQAPLGDAEARRGAPGMVKRALRLRCPESADRCCQRAMAYLERSDQTTLLSIRV